MKGQNWKSSVAPDKPVRLAAAIIVQARLKAVIQRLKKAVHSADEDIEHVHRLRVAARRGTASLNLFLPLLPKRRGHRWRKALRRLRRAAGDARDLDVLHDMFSNGKSLEADCREAIDIIKTCRRHAQRPLVAVFEKWPPSELQRRLSGLVKRVRWRGEGAEPSYRAYSLASVDARWQEFCAARDQLADDFQSLHALRIAVKQLRYSVELLCPVVSHDWMRVYNQAMKYWQDDLGHINDLVMMANRINHWLPHIIVQRPCMQELIAHCNHVAAEAAAQFRRQMHESRFAELAHLWQQMPRS